VKILDFGLAKAMAPESSNAGADAMNSPTLTARATQMGMVLGTAAYMAPEQARAKSVDRRADIWSFGCVLFEMLTGRCAFEGEEITDVLARVIEREPDWSAIPASTPSDVRRLVARCLAKDSKARLRDIGEARVAIDDALAGKNADVAAPAVPTGRPPSSSRRLLPWGLAGGFALVTAFLLILGWAPRPAGSQVRVDVTLPPDVEFYSGPSLSADGSALVFVATRQGVRQVYRRTLDDANVRPVPGTETTSVAAISPDGTSGAFLSPDTRLRRVSFATGLVEPLAEGAVTSSWPAWTGDGAIVFSRATGLVVRERNGKERELAKLDAAGGEVALSWPVIVSGGKSVLFASRRNSARGTTFRLETVPLAGGARRVVLDGGEQPIFASADRLVFRQDCALFIAPFDASSVTVTGQASRQNEAVTVTPSGGFAAAVAPVGTLATAPPSMLEAQMVWVSMNGVERIIRGPARAFLSPRVSPDGRLIAFVEAATIWTPDPERGTFTRVTSHVDPTISFPY
jgi:eukaryotic-like serine/threonine-protein kinase